MIATGLSAKSTASTDLVLSAYLSVLIHEAAHHWQVEYGGWAQNKYNWAGYKGYGFNFDQLSSLDLAKEQFASTVSSAFILSWQLDHSAESVALNFNNFSRFQFNSPLGHAGPPVNRRRTWGAGWGETVNRTIAGSLLWFFKPLMFNIGI